MRSVTGLPLAAYLRKLIFLRELIEYYEKRRKRIAEQFYEVLMDSVRRRHQNEAAALRRRYEALARLMQREWFTFDTKFARCAEPTPQAAAPNGSRYINRPLTSGARHRRHRTHCRGRGQSGRRPRRTTEAAEGGWEILSVKSFEADRQSGSVKVKAGPALAVQRRLTAAGTRASGGQIKRKSAA